MTLILALPALLLMALVFGWPMLRYGWLSLHASSVLTGMEPIPNQGANWIRLLEDPRFWQDAAQTLRFAGVSVGLEILLALAMALLLLLDATSGWRAGDVIVVASTDFEMDHAEQVTIAAVAHGGKTLILSSPLTHTHLSVSYTHGGKTIEMRAEVGILSRSVKVRGDEGSAETQWGAHIMLHSHGDNSAVGRFSNVELANVGQAFNLGASSRGCACARTATPRPGP